MTQYRKVKASTLKKRHLPYCDNCQKLLTEQHANGYSRICQDRETNETLAKYFYMYGAGCPNFVETN